MGTYSPNELSAEFMDVLKNEFIRNMSNINAVDFHDSGKTTDLINRWISDMTKGKIPKLYDEPLGTDTLVILASTLYFKASWKGKFDLIPKGTPEDKRLCWATSAEGLTKSECADVQWMTKEGYMAYFPIKRGHKSIATVIDIPLRNRKNEKDGKDLHLVSI